MVVQDSECMRKLIHSGYYSLPKDDALSHAISMGYDINYFSGNGSLVSRMDWRSEAEFDRPTY